MMTPEVLKPQALLSFRKPLRFNKGFRKSKISFSLCLILNNANSEKDKINRIKGLHMKYSIEQ